jgi:hypothetical protein
MLARELGVQRAGQAGPMRPPMAPHGHPSRARGAAGAGFKLSRLDAPGSLAGGADSDAAPMVLRVGQPDDCAQRARAHTRAGRGIPLAREGRAGPAGGRRRRGTVRESRARLDRPGPPSPPSACRPCAGLRNVDRTGTVTSTDSDDPRPSPGRESRPSCCTTRQSWFRDADGAVKPADRTAVAGPASGGRASEAAAAAAASAAVARNGVAGPASERRRWRGYAEHALRAEHAACMKT